MKKSTFIILCLEGALLSFNVAAAAALVPSISASFNIAPFIAGKIIWIYMIPYGVAALFYGPLVRIFEVKKIELICFLLFSISNLMAGLSRNITMLFWARFLMGLFGASVIPLILILISHHTLNKNRGKLVGIFFSSTFVASLLGLFLSGIVNWRLIFLIPAISGFILWIIMYLYLPIFKLDFGNLGVNYLSVLKNKNVLSIFTYIFLISLCYHGVQQWLGVYFSKNFGFNQFLISTLITLTSLSGIFGEILGGWFSDLIGRLTTVNIGTILMGISVFLLLLRAPFIVLSLIMIIWGLGWTFNHAAISTLLCDLPKEFLNEAASLNSSVRFIAGGLGAILGGILMQKSFTLTFLALGMIFLSLSLFSKSILRLTPT